VGVVIGPTRAFPLSLRAFFAHFGRAPLSLGIIWRGVPMGYHFISPISLGTGMVWGLCTMVKKILPHYAAKSQEGEQKWLINCG
jgi:hypothetical protein